jgi:hypothetical protein
MLVPFGKLNKSNSFFYMILLFSSARLSPSPTESPGKLHSTPDALDGVKPSRRISITESRPGELHSTPDALDGANPAKRISIVKAPQDQE